MVSMIKNSNADVLFKELRIKNSVIALKPEECPGKGRVDDLVYDENKQPVCINENVLCPYFKGFYIESSFRNKTINCSVIDVNTKNKEE